MLFFSIVLIYLEATKNRKDIVSDYTTKILISSILSSKKPHFRVVLNNTISARSVFLCNSARHRFCVSNNNNCVKITPFC